MDIVRSDGLNDNHIYMDNGCSFHDHCLTCPFEICRYDDGVKFKALRNITRNNAIVEMASHGTMTKQAIADNLGIAKRTVHRVLAQ